jgi:hypothetical protein
MIDLRINPAVQHQNNRHSRNMKNLREIMQEKFPEWFELGAYTLSHSTSPPPLFFVKGFSR